MSYYFVDKNLEGYNKGSIQALSKELEDIGFEYKQAQLGGGPSEIIQQVVAYLSIHEFLVGIFAGLAVNRIEKILTKLHKWYVSNKRSGDNIQPVVNIYIYSGKKPGVSLTLRIDQAPDKTDISNKIYQAKNNKS